MANTILSVRDLRVNFSLRGKTLTAVRGASLDLYENETLAIVGESGSGKSVLTKTLIGMTDKNGTIVGGSIDFKGTRLDQLAEKDWLAIRGKRIAMVFQDPMTALNPLKTVGEQIREMITLHSDLSKDASTEKAKKLMEQVGISSDRYGKYPHEFSGGMRQRIVIATAIAADPEVLICDEPTTALDVTLQAQILRLLRDIQRSMGLSVIFITHDLGVVANIADRVAVMYAGEIIETGPTEEVFSCPVHPYTRALLRALPQLGVKGQALFAIPGTPPNLYNDIQGDAFYPRNPEAMEIDRLEEPPMFSVSPGHTTKTWTMHPMAIQKWGDPRNYRTPGLGRAPAAPEPYAPRSDEPLLSVRDLSIDFGSGKKVFHAVNGVSFDVYRGETFSLVGESGSGKTTIGRAIMKIIPTAGGEILYKGTRVNRRFSREEIKQYRQQVQMIFQDPMASLNERAKVDYIISEGLYNFNLFENEADRKAKVSRVMQRVGLLPEFASRFPHEFSGGQRQRLGIARALIMEPEFIIADEPISALDVSIRAQIINLLNELKKEHSLTYLFIAHDLSVVRFISDRIGVIYKGALMELAPGEEIFAHPLHPYTRSLLSAIPMPDPAAERGKTCTPYNPSVHDYSVDKPAWTEIAPGHFVFANARECDEYRRMLG